MGRVHRNAQVDLQIRVLRSVGVRIPAAARGSLVPASRQLPEPFGLLLQLRQTALTDPLNQGARRLVGRRPSSAGRLRRRGRWRDARPGFRPWIRQCIGGTQRRGVAPQVRLRPWVHSRRRGIPIRHAQRVSYRSAFVRCYQRDGDSPRDSKHAADRHSAGIHYRFPSRNPFARSGSWPLSGRYLGSAGCGGMLKSQAGNAAMVRAAGRTHRRLTATPSACAKSARRPALRRPRGPMGLRLNKSVRA